MANQPSERTIINPRERPLSSDINQLQSQLDYGERWFAQHLYASRTSVTDERSVVTRSFFLNDGLSVVPNAGMTLTVQPGVGFIYDPGNAATGVNGAINADDLGDMRRVMVVSPQSIIVPAADPVFDRVDIVEIKTGRRAENPLSRDVLNPATGVFVPGLVNKTLSFLLDGHVSVNGADFINYKTGTPAGVPVAPPTSAGYTKIAEVYVVALAVSLPKETISDLRPMAWEGGVLNVGASISFSTVANNNQITQLAAPPGVRAGVIAQPGVGFYAAFLYVVAGDTTLARLGTSTVGFYSPGTVAGTDIVLDTSILTTKGALPGLEQTALVSSVQPLLMGPAQSLIKIGLRGITVDASGNRTNPVGNFTGRVNLTIIR